MGPGEDSHIELRTYIYSGIWSRDYFVHLVDLEMMSMKKVYHLLILRRRISKQSFLKTPLSHLIVLVGVMTTLKVERMIT